MSSPSTTTASASPPAPPSFESRLDEYCRAHAMPPPSFQIISDRRGGRTAWSCIVSVNGQTIPARFFYDGQFVTNAREDAAERALQVLGHIATPAGPPVNTVLAGQRPQFPGQKFPGQ